MSKDRVKSSDRPYKTVRISDLRITRRGKHHTLMTGILEQLGKLADGSALIIPLNSVGELSLASLRSAVARATSARHMAITTYSDPKNFYIWKKNSEESEKKARPRKQRQVMPAATGIKPLTVN